jgi:hypothetical protein
MEVPYVYASTRNCLYDCENSGSNEVKLNAYKKKSYSKDHEPRMLVCGQHDETICVFGQTATKVLKRI